MRESSSPKLLPVMLASMAIAVVIAAGFATLLALRTANMSGDVVAQAMRAGWMVQAQRTTSETPLTR